MKPTYDEINAYLLTVRYMPDIKTFVNKYLLEVGWTLEEYREQLSLVVKNKSSESKIFLREIDDMQKSLNDIKNELKILVDFDKDKPLNPGAMDLIKAHLGLYGLTINDFFGGCNVKPIPNVRKIRNQYTPNWWNNPREKGTETFTEFEKSNIYAHMHIDDLAPQTSDPHLVLIMEGQNGLLVPTIANIQIGDVVTIFGAGRGRPNYAIQKILPTKGEKIIL
jgi:hypothetical protein